MTDVESNPGHESLESRGLSGRHRAVLLATELGMDESFTAATTRALQDLIGDVVRRLAAGVGRRQDGHTQRPPA